MDEVSPDFNGSEIAIIGMAGRFPGARNVEEFWRNLEAGIESISFFSDEELLAAGITPSLLDNPALVRAGGVVEGSELFDAGFFGFSPRETEITDPQQRLFLECAWEALENAGYDPETFPGSIGVYAGAGLSTYLINVYSNQPAIQSVGLYRALLGNDKDFLPTWVSYKFDLRGPSVNANTACSTSLVTAHLACQSLLNGESDMALAGGSTINVQQKTGYLYQPGGILSPDGHCRAFDASAQGTVGGSGVGVVVLKRLADALAEGDTIYAVVRGSAINNDGSAKAGYTAPSVAGQAKVISEALVVAGVDPGTISYVEAHGTGTELGDPIEIEALTQAYRAHTQKKGYCAIGSVKTNIGHVDSAAGVAGLIKTTLALVHKSIPASLHFERPNPRIDFESSPFFVNTERREWAANGTPRRAAVSSFGIGGTNAHFILEEAPPPESSEPGREWQLMVISSRSAAALDRATANLAEHLGERPDLALADVAFTLQVGRKAFAHRRMVVANGLDDAIATLSSLDPNRVLTGAYDGRHRPVVFLFPGSGAQYVGMGAELYRSEPAFREELDRCAEMAAPHLGFDLRACLFADPGEMAAQELQRTSRAMPAIFATEYALAKLWMAWGIEPQAMLGHSLGEYVAACLAGVFDLADAMALVALRGRLLEELPEGAMLSVGLTEAEVAPYLCEEISLAAVNTPSHCVLSGPAAAIEALQERLAGIETNRLHVEAALHSSLLDPVLERFGSFVATLPMRGPTRPLLSCITGTWLTAEEATDPGYWVRHLRQTVRFAAGMSELLREPDRVLLEVGPGRTLTTLASHHPGRGIGHIVLPSMRHPQDRSSDAAFLLGTLGRLWLAGIRPDWNALYTGESRRRVPLPTYPFERQRYWIEARRGTDTRELAAAADLPKAEEVQHGETETALSLHLRPALQSAYVAPRNESERRVAKIWQVVLGVEPVGIHDNLFELGGHSLLLVQLASMVRDELGVDIPIRTMAQAPTVAELALAVQEHKSEGRESAGSLLPVLVHAPEHRYEPFPLTEVQEAYWIGRNAGLELGGVASHQYTEFESSELDLERFERAWQRLIDRHEMLRVIVLPDGRQQILESPPPYKIEIIDLRGLPPEVVQPRLLAIRRRMGDQVIPADRWPLFEIRASLLDGGRVRLHMSIDLLIVDNWSLQILRQQLALFYANPDAELAPLEVSFRDHVLAEVAFRDSEVYRRSLDYWMRRVPTLSSGPDLPLVKSPSALDKPRFVRRQASLDPEAWGRLKGRAAKAGLTPSGVLLAAYSQVLATWSKSARFLVNLTLFNRMPLHPQIPELIGDFTSLILVEVDFSAATSFEARAQRLQNQLWEDLDHRHVSGVRVTREVIRARGRTTIEAVAPVVFTSAVNAQIARQGDGAGSAGGAVLSGSSGFSSGQTPQVWLDHVVGEEEGWLNFSWDVVEELFPAGMIQEMFAAYVGLLGRLADEEEAWQELPCLVPEGQRELMAAANATATPLPEGLLQQPFLAQAAARPDHPAVVSSGCTLSYGELLRLANRLGHRLRASGAEPNRLVAVVMEKGWEQVLAVLGVLQAGAAYLPIDPELPAGRIAYLLRQGEVKLALTQPGWDEKLTWPIGLERLRVTAADLSGWPDEPPAPVQKPEDLAYVIFTSGSTGQPKGVMIDHRGALNTVIDINRRFAVGPQDRVLGLSALSFDLSVYDVFGTLAAGATLVLPDASGTREPSHWENLIIGHGVTIWNSVPALLKMLADHAAGQPEPLASLRLALLSGDWIPVHLPDQVRSLNPGLEVISLGGATEASIWSILYQIGEVDPAWTSIPYGKAMDNQRFHILDEALEPRPVWVPGQLYIAGIGLAQGYWRDETRTSASFFVHPRSGERLYRTGDLGRYLPDGNIEFMGREDFQVKIQGFRIELGEIETALAEHPLTADAVVAAVGERRGEKRLIAYVVPAGQARRAAAAPRDDQRTKEAAAWPSPPEFGMGPVSADRLEELFEPLRLVGSNGSSRRRSPSLAGNSVGAYVYVKPDRVEGLAGGAYRYEPRQHRLIPLESGGRFQASSFGPRAGLAEQCTFAVVFGADPAGGETVARDSQLIEAGSMAQLLLSAAPTVDLGLVPVDRFEPGSLQSLFASAETHDFLFGLLGGCPASGEPVAEAAAPAAVRVLPADAALIEELRAHLQARLPRYMMPASFILLDSLPLSSNGKVDRQVLPAPDRAVADDRREIVEPGTPLEISLAGIWKEILGLEDVGVQDSFFEAGGHSLLAARLAARIRETLRVQLSLASIFEAPTIAGMAAQIENLLAEGSAMEARADDLPVMEPRPESWHEPFPLTDLQQAYWVGRTGAFEMNVSPQMYLEIEAAADLDIGRLELALQRTIQRHPMLRTVILPSGQQQVLRQVPSFRIDVVDLSELPRAAQGAALETLRCLLAEEPIALEQWPLLRVQVSRTAARRFCIHLTISLLICDAWGNGIFARELQLLYSNPEATLEPLEISFRDYVMALQDLEVTAFYQQSLSYWRSRLADLPPAPELPLSRNPVALSRTRFVRRTGTLDRAAWWRFKRRARQAGLTPDGALCAVYSEILAAWSKRQHFLLDILYFNRLPLHPQVGSILGNFSTTVLLEVDLTRAGTFTERARGIQEQLWRDLEHSVVSGVRVLRELNRLEGTAARVTAPVVFASAVGLAGGEMPAEEPPPAQGGEASPFPPGHLQTPQVWLDHQVFEEMGVLGFNWDAVEDLFPEGMVQEMFDAYCALLRRLAAEDAGYWQEEVRPMLPEAQLDLYRFVNATAAPLSGDRLQDLFAAQVERRLDEPAVISSGRTLTYRELERLSAQLAQDLQKLGAAPDRLVAVVMDKGWEQAVAVLAVLRSGAAYLPIDPGLPAERFRYLLEKGEAELAVTRSTFDDRLDWPAGVRRLRVDAEETGPSRIEPPVSRQGPDDLAYVIFTSGSTGLPKGVMIEHRGAVNTVLDINERFGVGSEDRVLALSSLAFDLSVYDIFGLFAAGGAVVIPDSADLREPSHWLDWIERERVTVWNSVPALAQMLVDHLAERGERLPSCLRLVMLSGDWVPVTLPDRLRALGDVEVVSLGGATEASIWSILYPVAEVDPTWPSIPYGHPMSNQRWHVLNEALEPCPVWVPGHLYIAGAGLARGYWRDEERTAVSFFHHPRTKERLYRTGDLGRYLPDGNIEFLGREDLQVKIQGYRIELGEIEAALARHPGVRSSAVIALGEKHGPKSLAAYVVPEPQAPATSEDLRAFLQATLPEYMVPHTLAMVPELPLTGNGKIDRGALAALSTGQSGDAASAVPPRDELELEMTSLWEQLLGLGPIGIRDNFFDLGGHSLLAVRLMAQIERRFGRNLPLSILFEGATVEHLAAVLRQEIGTLPRRPLVRIQPGGDRPPFFCVHPVGGSVLCYLDLARQLGPEQPVYGLQVPDGDGEARLDSIEAMAAAYVEAMRAVQPSGPYRIGGWSMGGVIAFEMARRLRAAGEEIALLAVIDATAQEGAPAGLDDAAMLAAFAEDLARQSGKRLSIQTGELRGLPFEEALSRAFEQIVASGALPLEIGRDETLRFFEVYRTNLSALNRYRPDSYAGDVVLFRAAEEHAGAVDPDLGWRRVVAGRLTGEALPGDHYTIVQEPLVGTVAERLRPYFAAAPGPDEDLAEALAAPEEGR